MCVLAQSCDTCMGDDMLMVCRKTFQTLASLYFLLTKGVFGHPTCKKPLILCPTSLVQVRCALRGWTGFCCAHAHGRGGVCGTGCCRRASYGIGIMLAALLTCTILSSTCAGVLGACSHGLTRCLALLLAELGQGGGQVAGGQAGDCGRR